VNVELATRGAAVPPGAPPDPGSAAAADPARFETLIAGSASAAPDDPGAEESTTRAAGGRPDASDAGRPGAPRADAERHPSRRRPSGDPAAAPVLVGVPAWLWIRDATSNVPAAPSHQVGSVPEEAAGTSAAGAEAAGGLPDGGTRSSLNDASVPSRSEARANTHSALAPCPTPTASIPGAACPVDALGPAISAAGPADPQHAGADRPSPAPPPVGTWPAAETSAPPVRVSPPAGGVTVPRVPAAAAQTSPLSPPEALVDALFSAAGIDGRGRMVQDQPRPANGRLAGAEANLARATAEAVNVLASEAQTGSSSAVAPRASAEAGPESDTRRRSEASNSGSAAALSLARAVEVVSPAAGAHAPSAAAPLSMPAAGAAPTPGLPSAEIPAGLASMTAGPDPLPGAAGQADVMNQLVQAIRLQWRDGLGDARLTLQPEYLGEVTISLRVDQQSVSAHISAASPDIRQWVASSESLLRAGLADQGLTLDRLVVSDRSPERDPDRDRGQKRPQPGFEPPRRRPREAATFEITV